jgi:RNA polymerase-binding transcription factor DksA
MCYLTIEQRESLEALLKARAENLREEIARALCETDGPKSLGRANDGRTADLESYPDISEFQRHLNALREVEQGLAHLHAPDYGICAACGAKIPYSRLSENPAAVRCVRCQVRFEHRWTQIAEHTL